MEDDLSGTIPSEFGNLTIMSNLNLASNDLSGPIPPALGEVAGLRRLNLASNALSGTIPPEFGNLTMMSDLNLTSNDLSGPIPARGGQDVDAAGVSRGEQLREDEWRLADRVDRAGPPRDATCRGHWTVCTR